MFIKQALLRGGNLSYCGDLGCRCWFTCTRFAPTSVCRVSTDINFKRVYLTNARYVFSNVHSLNKRIVVYNLDAIVFMHKEGGSREYNTKNRPIFPLFGHEQATASSRSPQSAVDAKHMEQRRIIRVNNLKTF